MISFENLKSMVLFEADGCTKYFTYNYIPLSLNNNYIIVLSNSKDIKEYGCKKLEINSDERYIKILLKKPLEKGVLIILLYNELLAEEDEKINNKLKIIIRGGARSGKTFMQKLIYECLEKLGYNILILSSREDKQLEDLMQYKGLRKKIKNNSSEYVNYNKSIVIETEEN